MTAEDRGFLCAVPVERAAARDRACGFFAQCLEGVFFLGDIADPVDPIPACAGFAGQCCHKVGAVLKEGDKAGFCQHAFLRRRKVQVFRPGQGCEGNGLAGTDGIGNQFKLAGHRRIISAVLEADVNLFLKQFALRHTQRRKNLARQCGGFCRGKEGGTVYRIEKASHFVLFELALFEIIAFTVVAPAADLMSVFFKKFNIGVQRAAFQRKTVFAFELLPDLRCGENMILVCGRFQNL